MRAAPLVAPLTKRSLRRKSCFVLPSSGNETPTRGTGPARRSAGRVDGWSACLQGRGASVGTLSGLSSRLPREGPCAHNCARDMLHPNLPMPLQAVQADPASWQQDMERQLEAERRRLAELQCDEAALNSMAAYQQEAMQVLGFADTSFNVCRCWSLRA